MAAANEFELLASLLRYPIDGYPNDAPYCCDLLANTVPAIAAPLGEFLRLGSFQFREQRQRV